MDRQQLLDILMSTDADSQPGELSPETLEKIMEHIGSSMPEITASFSLYQTALATGLLENIDVTVLNRVGHDPVVNIRMPAFEARILISALGELMRHCKDTSDDTEEIKISFTKPLDSAEAVVLCALFSALSKGTIDMADKTNVLENNIGVETVVRILRSVCSPSGDLTPDGYKDLLDTVDEMEESLLKMGTSPEDMAEFYDAASRIKSLSKG